MTKKTFMTPITLRTILNTAPIIIQGATKLIQILRQRVDNQSDTVQDMPMTVEGLKAGVERIEARLDARDESNIEQIKLIEQLARQNEALAESLGKTTTRLNIITFVSGVTVILALVVIILVLF